MPTGAEVSGGREVNVRKYGRTDANHQAVKQALEAIGASVQSLANLGDGVPDLLVGYKRRDVKMEVKDGGKSPSRRQLTPAQLKWQFAWKGSLTVNIYSPEEAVAFLENWGDCVF